MTDALWAGHREQNKHRPDWETPKGAINDDVAAVTAAADAIEFKICDPCVCRSGPETD